MSDLGAFEAEMHDYACEVIAEANEVLKLLRDGGWRWGCPDPFDTIEAARALTGLGPRQ